MNDRQRAKCDTYGRVKNFNDKHSAALAAIPDYAIEQTAFDSTVSTINGLLSQQTRDNKGIAKDVRAAKLVMAVTVIKYARRARVKARHAGNQAVAVALNHSKKYINHSSALLGIERATALRNCMNDNLAICTNITLAHIAEMDSAINDYTQKHVKPVSARQNKKANTTNALPALFRQADKSLHNMFDLVSSYLTGTDSGIADEMRLNMRNIHTGVHYTGVHIIVAFDDASTIFAEGVTFKIIDLKKSAISDIKGEINLRRLKPGTFHAELSGTEIETKTFIVKIVRGKILKLAVTVAAKS